MTVHQMLDANRALGFVVSQTAAIEAQVYKKKYPSIQYPRLIPVDTSANNWATSVTYFTSDRTGEAGWIGGSAQDVPRVDTQRTKSETPVYMAGIGYGYSFEEIGQAQMLGQSLPAERAEAARRVCEEFIDKVAIRGDAVKGFNGLIDYPGITTGAASNNAAGNSPLWTNKSGDEILKDINDALTGVYTSSLTTEMADTIGLPVAQFAALNTRRLGDTQITLMNYLKQANVYTATTGQELTIVGIRGLEAAGAGGTARMIAYARDPEVLKLHMPMPHQFLEAYRSGPLHIEMPGVMRLGGLDIRRLGAVRYVDGI